MRLQPQIDMSRVTDILRLWRWTVAAYSFVLVACYWFLLFSGSIWGSKFRYAYLYEGSLPIMVLLSVTAIFSFVRQRRYATFCLVVFLAWLVWALLPRF